MTIFYTGIGSRETPQEVMEEMSLLASCFALRGWTLRSGGADGADLAFEYGCGDGAKEIFLPWKGFNNNASDLYEIPDAAYEIAAKYHPAWLKLKTPTRRLMARNVQQVLGKNLDSPSSFVVCYTKDGCESHKDRTQSTGGTGQAISIASKHKIPVINLNHEDAIDRLHNLLTTLQLYE